MYFNAWESDYVEDPFISLVAELKDIGTDEAFEKLVPTAIKVGACLFGLAKGVVNKYVLDVDSVMNELNDLYGERLKKYLEQKQSLENFKTALSDYIASPTEKSLPVVFVVDELDRCNPMFAVKLLERIKHLFDIPNIAFVLSISKSQLECSIKGFFGNNEFDAANYLRRFIDVEMVLPKPIDNKFIDLLYSNYSYEQFFVKHKDSGACIDSFILNAKRLFDSLQIDLRTWDKIFSHCRLIAMEISENLAPLMPMLLLLCVFKIKYPNFFYDIKSRKYSCMDLVKQIEQTIPQTLFYAENKTFIYVIANLVVFYNKGFQKEFEPEWYNNVNAEQWGLKDIDASEFLGEIRTVMRSIDSKYRHIHFDIIMERVNLLGGFMANNI